MSALRASVVTLVLFAAPLCLRAQAVTQVESQKANETHPPTVLMLFSFRAHDPGVLVEQPAIEQSLPELLGGRVNFRVYYLEVPDLSNADRRLQIQYLAQKYAAERIDLVMVQGVEGLRLLLEHEDTLLPGVPIVFFHIFEYAARALHRPSRVTGVVSIAPSFTPAPLHVTPGARRVVLLAGSSPAERGAAAATRDLITSEAPQLAVESLDGRAWDDQLQRIRELPRDSILLFLTYATDSDGRRVDTNFAVDTFSKAAPVPMYSAEGVSVGHGALGGEVVQYDVVARQAAAVAARVLKGAAPSSIPPEVLSANALVFDARQLQRWNISERALPPGSVVLNREQTLWSQYKWTVVGTVAALGVQGLLIAGLFVERRGRHQARRGLADAELRYRTVADSGADWEYWVKPDGNLEYVSPSCETISGYAPQAFYDDPPLTTTIVAKEDRARWSEHLELGRRTAGPHALQFRITTRSGDTRWIEHLCARVTSPDGRDLGRRVANRDITQRKHEEELLREALAENQHLRDQLEVDNAYMREQLQPEGVEGIVAESDAMRYVVVKVHQVAPTASTVLLQGETGVGKSLIAAAIHELSDRSRRPLVTLNCAALPPNLIESELFGHERGAFTGAHSRRLGRFEVADGGTLFLDEVGDLPLELQGKLLRAVQDGEFERVGSNVTLKTNVRLIAATNRRLENDVAAGRFRQDLLYRLNVFPITIPPLRQRREDIPALVAHLLVSRCRALGMPAPTVSKAAMNALQARAWPGNVRELENVIERGLIVGRATGRLEVEAEAERQPVGDMSSYRQRTLEQVERDHIVETLERLQWRIEGEAAAAATLWLNASTLRGRMRKLGITRPRGVAASS